MASSPPQDEHASLLRSIDEQIASIASANNNDPDHVYVLSVWQAQLREWKSNVERIPTESSAQPTNIVVPLVIDNKHSANDTGRVQAASLSIKFEEDDPTDCILLESGPCNACLEQAPLEKMIALPCCQERYHGECFQLWIETNLHSKDIPRCCNQEIEMRNFMDTLSAELIQQVEELKEEIHAEHKVYCSDPMCATFLRPSADRRS
ncbi:hypothetical protein H2198_007908 [Neophaeococcomyces mojaviensis]|uniref:Uncharacterized protein n=1 Tax=Neophaeococcomyces mojaviensis TaxID=3383035 RepID=A0ACC2ZYT1_9EURO|nr:hypothetical protein H2198_007908 [Knufia sp. JES_112]